MNPLDDPPIPGNQRDLSQILRNHIRLTSSSQAPHVTEISLISATRKAILSGIQKMDALMNAAEINDQVPRHSRFSSFRIPCNVYSAQIKPRMSQREWKEYEKAQLQYNVLVYAREDLEDKNDFATEWKGIKLFLEQTRKPVCIIAHNGLRFDFRILHAEFERNGLLNISPIPDQVYFVDSYLMFLDLEKKLHDELRAAVQLLDWSRLSTQLKSESLLSPPQKISSCLEGSSSETHADVISKPLEIPEVQNISCVESKGDTATVNEESQDISFIVPVECSVGNEIKRPARRQLFTSDDHPLNFIRTTKWSPAKKKRVRPNLFKRSNEGEWMFNNHFSVSYFREKGAFKLESMYKQLLNGNYDAHYARDDCEALLKICMAYGEEFVEYVDSHAMAYHNEKVQPEVLESIKATVVVRKLEDDDLTEEMQESSDSESEIEPSVYERRRELNAWRTVLAEKLFTEAKKKLYAEKLKQLEKRQAEVLSQEAADFIKKKEEILKEYHDRLQYIEVIRALRTESLKRRTIGQLECAQQNFNNNKRMAYEKTETNIWTKMQKLDDDMKRCTKEYVNFCREFERSRERERRKRKRYPVASVIERLLGDAVSSLMDPYNENVNEDLFVCEQALKARTNILLPTLCDLWIKRNCIF
ncbi:Breast cancer metastasis-suppressor 1-like protein-A [Dirofilaria immitis]